jgi:SAM-dependent methyltransferase
MVCHGELARSKPAARHLTGFYLMLALGGALGGVLVGLIAPAVFDNLYELPIGMFALCIFVFAALYRDRGSFLHGRWGPAARVALAASIFAFGAALGYVYHDKDSNVRVMARNFYGVLNVHDSGEGTDEMRILSNGTIIHGKQFLLEARRDWPTSYYAMESGVGLAILSARAKGPVRVGVVGLGAGTLASYGRAGDVYRFYDINPEVVELARSEFSFLKDSPARIEIVLGDARLSLEREPKQNFDVLVLDAFSSDAIPVHLLTSQAVGVYLRHLKPDGILAVHISNRYLDLVPVVEQAARHYSLEARRIENRDDDDAGVYRSDWMLLSASPRVFESELLKDAGEETDDDDSQVGLWTDDYSNLYRILK